MDNTKKQNENNERAQADAATAATATVSKDTVDALRKAWHADRIARGLVDADYDFMRPAVTEWCRAVTAGDTPSADCMARFHAAVHETLSLRDAFLVYALAGGDMDEDEALAAAAAPHSPRGTGLVFDTLNGVFRTRTDAPDPTWARNAVRAYAALFKSAPDPECKAMACACTAYVVWWCDDPETAMGGAECALGYDPKCSLAGIVRQAIQFGVHPRWADGLPLPDGVQADVDGTYDAVTKDAVRAITGNEDKEGKEE